MGQVKKTAVRDAVLSSAAALFESRGYHATTVSQIAKGAKTATSNVYVYFPSKFEIAVAIYQPWFEDQIRRLEIDALKIADAGGRMRSMLTRLWLEIPTMRGGFIKTFLQAVSSASAGDYSPSLLNFMEAKIESLILSCLPPEKHSSRNWRQVAHIIMMAFDGFAINTLVQPFSSPNGELVDVAVSLILNGADQR